MTSTAAAHTGRIRAALAAVATACAAALYGSYLPHPQAGPSVVSTAAGPATGSSGTVAGQRWSANPAAVSPIGR
ncbi:hypothetical protein [Jatrophihabitans sp.]|uniref:hypothetical protein n=1 Tax=Jatrophihabitans sp. TaxID=1932789 RepID=UPI002CD17EF7|nr:hypothetical protein [Jatrophihabitans sp.]